MDNIPEDRLDSQEEELIELGEVRKDTRGWIWGNVFDAVGGYFTR